MSGNVVEELITKIGLEVDPEALEVLESFEHAVHKGLTALAAGGAAIAGIFAELVISTAEAGAQIAVTAEKLGVTTDTLQELKYAANQSNVSFDSLSTGLKFLQKNAVEAAQGGSEAAQAFKGIKTRDANGKFLETSELLGNVVDKFGSLQEGAKQTEFAIKVFGRSGIDMVPMLKKGRAAIAELSAEAHTLGVVLDHEAIEASEHFERANKRLHSSLEGLRNIFAAPFIEAFANALDKVTGFLVRQQPLVRRLSAAFKETGERVMIIVRIFGQLYDAAARLFSGVGLDKIFAMVDAMKILEAVLIGLGAIMAFVAAETILDWALAAAPFILIAALIGLIIDDVANWLAGNESLTGHLLGNFKDITAAIKPVIDGIHDLWTALTNKSPWDLLSLNGKRAAVIIARLFDDMLPAFLGGHKIKREDSEAAVSSIDDQIAIDAARTEGNRFGSKQGTKAGLAEAFSRANANLADIQGGGTVTASGGAGGVSQTNNVTVNAANMSPAEAQKAVADAMAQANRELAALSQGGF